MAVNSVDAPNSTTGDDFSYLLIVLPVAMLVTHHSFDPSILHGLSNLNGFVHRECHGLFVGNELGAGMYSDLKKIHADLRWRAKAKYVGADLS